MDSLLFPTGAALSELVSLCGSYVGVGVGVGLSFYMIGYVVWFVIDLLRGGV